MSEVVAVQPKKSWLKKWWLYVVAAVIIVAAIGGTWWYVRHIKNDTPADTSSNFDQKTADQLNQLQSEALYGDTNKAIQGYDDALKATSDSDKERNLLLGKAMAADQAKQYDQALEAAQAADAIKSDYRSLATIALIYMDRGDNAKAADYYTKAADDQSEFNVDKDFYRQEAARLAGQQS